MNTSTQELLQNALDLAVADGTVAGVNLLVSHQGDERWYAQAGMRSLERREPMSRNVIFRLFSQTKPITGTALMMLVERGLVDLAQPVSDFLPGFKNPRVSTEYLQPSQINGPIEMTPYAGTDGSFATPIPTVAAEREVTIKDLLTMTSGLPYPDTSFDSGRHAAAVFGEIDRRLHTDHAMTTLEVANRLGACPLRFQPGSRWMYGTSADIIGAVVEVASGRRFGDFLRTEIFEPLSMKDTAFHVPPEKQARLADVYDNPDNPVDPKNAGRPLTEVETDNLGVQYVAGEDPAYQAGGAGLKSTIDDYMKFATMLLNGGTLHGNRIIEPATIAFMTTGALTSAQRRDFEGLLHGYDYNTFMRIASAPGHAESVCNAGEYGWDGWLGTYFCNDPATRTTFLLMYQLTNAGTTTFTRKVKNIVFTHLGD
jgi:CubicO group peptidase (beta-lactamase class C family)